MDTVIPALSVPIAAFAIWVAVRTVNGRKRPLRFILLSMGTIGAILGVWALFVHHQYRQQMQLIAVIERLGGGVRFRRDARMWLQRLQPDGEAWCMVEEWGPNCLREWLPATEIVKHFDVVEFVYLDNYGPDLFSHFSARSDEYRSPVEPTDDDLVQIAKFVHLQDLYLRDKQIGDIGIKHLENLRELKRIAIIDTRITDQSLDVIAGFENLEYLRLSGTQITDAGLAKLAKCKQLKCLDVQGTAVTKSGLKSFRDMPALNLLTDHDPEDVKIERAIIALGRWGLPRFFEEY